MGAYVHVGWEEGVNVGRVQYFSSSSSAVVILTPFKLLPRTLHDTEMKHDCCRIILIVVLYVHAQTHRANSSRETKTARPNPLSLPPLNLYKHPHSKASIRPGGRRGLEPNG